MGRKIVMNNQPDGQVLVRIFFCILYNYSCVFFPDFYPYFSIHDLATGTKGRYAGLYTLKVIGGSSSEQDIQRFSQEQVQDYNTLR